MSDISELENWAKSQIPEAQTSVRKEDQFFYIDWTVENQVVGIICIEEREDVCYMISFQLSPDYQKRGIFKSFAAFIPGWSRNRGAKRLGVISANVIMRSLIDQCGFKRGQDPNDYFVDISMEDSPPEQYGNFRP